MFSLQIVDTDAFLDMPLSTQALYFHLVMRADDEGFVSNPKKIMRLIGCQDDDLKVLIGKRFILTFESGVVVIKHWLIHNTIRMDRFNKTAYIDERKSLKLKENKSYTEDVIPNGNQMATTGKHKLSKVKLSKVLSAKADEVFSSDNEINKLKSSKQRHIQIIGLYFSYLNVQFGNKQQIQAQIKRNARGAKDLIGYSDEQIKDTMLYLDKITENGKKFKWTLETILKYINEKV